MGRGRGKSGKSRRGKGQGQSSEHSAAAKQHAAEINARRRAEGKETRSTGSITRSQRAPAPDRGRSRSPAREAAPKTAAKSSSSYEATDEEAPRPPVQTAAGEFLPAARQGNSDRSRHSPRSCLRQGARPRPKRKPSQRNQELRLQRP